MRDVIGIPGAPRCPCVIEPYIAATPAERDVSQDRAVRCIRVGELVAA